MASKVTARSGMSSGCFNLVKTIVGGGLITFPYLNTQYAIVPTILLACIAAFFACVGLMLLCECGFFCKRRSTTFSSVMQEICPRMSSLLDVVVFLKCYGVSVSYLIILKSIIPLSLAAVVGGDPGWYDDRRNVILGVYLLLLSPVVLLKDLKSLRFTSLLGLVGAAVVILVALQSMVLAYGRGAGGPGREIEYFRYPEANWLTHLGQFVFAFTCHQNIFGIMAGIPEPSAFKMGVVVVSSVSAAFAMYVSFGLIMYLTYGNSVKQNALESLPQGAPRTVAMAFYIVLISCSYPLQTHPARDCLVTMAASLKRALLKRLGREAAGGKGEWLRILATAALVLTTYLISTTSISLSLIQAIIGGSASTVMCYIIPPLCYLSIPRKPSAFFLFSSAALMVGSLFAVVGVVFAVKQAYAEIFKP